MATTFAPQTYSTEPRPGADNVPTGYTPIANSANGKLAGTDGNDRVSIIDLIKDNDQIIKTGAGDDIFNFNGSESKLPQNLDRVNGIVDMGEGGNDIVYLGYQLSDYTFTLRSDGGIKIQYTGDNHDIDGVAVTFRNADTFTFRNVDDQTGVNYETISFSHDQLAAAIKAGGFFEA